MIAFVTMWLPYTTEMMPAHMFKGYPSYAFDWLNLWSQFHYQCMQMYEFTIALIYFICPVYPGCPYTWGFDTSTPDQFMQFMRHWFPISVLTIDFAISATRFHGWKTWANLAIALWGLAFYLLTNYSHGIYTSSSLYGIFDWNNSPETSLVWCAAVFTFGFLLWWVYVEISLFKDNYFVDAD